MGCVCCLAVGSRNLCAFSAQGHVTIEVLDESAQQPILCMKPRLARQRNVANGFFGGWGGDRQSKAKAKAEVASQMAAFKYLDKEKLPDLVGKVSCRLSVVAPAF